MAERAGSPLYPTTMAPTVTAYEPGISSPAAAIHLACTADKLQALQTKAVNQEGNIHAARVRDALDRLGQ